MIRRVKLALFVVSLGLLHLPALLSPARVRGATSTATPSPTATPSATATASATATDTQTPTFTPTPSATASITPTSTPTPSATASPSASATPTSTGTATPTPTDENTPTATATSTAIPTLALDELPAGLRVTEGLQVLYTFEEATGTTVQDVSGIGLPLNLTITEPAAVSWMPGGLRVDAPASIQSAGGAAKVIAAVRGSSEVTVEAWVQAANTTQDGPARMVSISADSSNRNVTLGQGLWGTWHQVCTIWCCGRRLPTSLLIASPAS